MKIDNSYAFAAALHPERITVAGVRLMPFMLGHAILLTRLHSPLACLWTGEQKEVNVGDVALALWICQRTATESMSRIGSRLASWQVRRLAKRVASIDAYAETSALMAYIANGFSGPKMRSSPDSARCGAPMLAMLYAGLLSHFHRTDAEALNTPLALALWNRAAFLEEKGLVSVWTQDDQDLVEYAEELAENPERLRELFPNTEESNG